MCVCVCVCVCVQACVNVCVCLYLSVISIPFIIRFFVTVKCFGLV